MEEDETLKDLLCHTDKKQQHFREYQYVDHHIKIVSHGRDDSSLDAHEQAMLSTKTEERPTEKQRKSMFFSCTLIYKTGHELIL